MTAADRVERGDKPVVTFLLPSYKTPLLVSELLNTAVESGRYDRCTFMLLLDTNDNMLDVYRGMTRVLSDKGLSVGHVLYDGTPYAGMINRVAMLADTRSLCVIDAKHLPYCKEGGLATHVEKWLDSSAEPMRLAVFGKSYAFPVVTPSLIDRLGYMFHPLAMGRVEAEKWLIDLARATGIASSIPDTSVISSRADGAEILGVSAEHISKWVGDVLSTYLELEAERLSDYVLK